MNEHASTGLPHDVSAPPSTDGATPVPAAQVATLRRAAVEYVVRATACPPELFAEGSAEPSDLGGEAALAFVDHYIVQAKNGPKLQPEVLRLVASALGVYLGELLIARFGGRWLALPQKTPPHAKKTDGDRSGETAQAAGLGTLVEYAAVSWRVELAAAPLRIDPVAMAATALLPHSEAADDVPVFALTVQNPNLYEALHAALDRSSPVSSDYYYSLTGRFETLVYIVDLLTDLRRAAQPPQ
jgi:hypothetical protein